MKENYRKAKNMVLEMNSNLDCSKIPGENQALPPRGSVGAPMNRSSVWITLF